MHLYRTARRIVPGILATSLAIAGAGCTVIPRQSGLASSAENVAASNDEIRTQVYGNALGFSGGVRDIANFIIAETDDPEIRRRALKFKMETISASQIIVAYNDPLISILDLWAFSIQIVNFYRDGQGRNDFGPFQDTLVASLEQVPPIIRERAMRLVKDTTAVAADEIIKQWAADHPIQESVARRRWMVDTLATFYNSQGMGAAGAMGVMAERISNLSDRLAIYYAFLPDQMRWEGEVFLEDVMARNGEIRTALDSVRSMSASLGRVVQIAEEGSPLFDSLLQTVRQDLRVLLVEALDSVDVIRLAAFADAGQEIDDILAAVQQERQAVMATLDTLTHARIDQSVRAVRSLIWVGLLIGAVLLVAPFVLGFVVGRVAAKNTATV
jgi:hypothetical protein